MSSTSMRLWIGQIQEAYEGETSIKQAVNRDLIQYGQEAARMQTATGNPPPDYPQLKVAADLMNILHTYVDELSQSETLKSAPALTLLSKLKNVRMNQMAKQLDNVARIPTPKDDKS